MKLCNKCSNEGIFGNDKRNKDGLQNTCNDCINKRRREKYKLNPKKYRDRQKKYNSYALKKQKNHIKEISDVYVISELKRGTNLNTNDIKKFPALIELKRQIILNKRKIKDEKRKRIKG